MFGNIIPGPNTRAPAAVKVGFELATDGIQFLGVVRQQNFPRRRKFLERRFGGMSIAVLIELSCLQTSVDEGI